MKVKNPIRFVRLGSAKRLTQGTTGVGMEIATLRKDNA